MVSSYRLGQFSQACTSLEIKHHRTRPYMPRTNGEAERFIQTVLREWTYANHWADSGEKDAHLQPWIDYYNRDDPIVASTTSRPSAAPTTAQRLDQLQAAHARQQRSPLKEIVVRSICSHFASP